MLGQNYFIRKAIARQNLALHHSHDVKELSALAARRRSTNFRLWLQADIQSPEIEVCFTPESGHSHGHH